MADCGPGGRVDSGLFGHLFFCCFCFFKAADDQSNGRLEKDLAINKLVFLGIKDLEIIGLLVEAGGSLWIQLPNVPSNNFCSKSRAGHMLSNGLVQGGQYRIVELSTMALSWSLINDIFLLSTTLEKLY